MTSTKVDVPPKTVVDADAQISAKEAELAALEAETKKEIQNLVDSGAPEDKIKEAEKIARTESPSVESEVGRTLDEARTIYVKEYLKCKQETKKQVRINKLRTQISNITTKTVNLFRIEDKPTEKFNEEDYFTKEYKNAKEVYNRTRVELGNAMYDAKKADLEKTGLSGADLETALTRYKATEILNETIINERQKLINAKIENNHIEPAFWEKIVKGYAKLPPWQKRALSVALFTAAAGTGMIGAGAYAGWSLAGMAATKFGASMAIGYLTTFVTKGVKKIQQLGDKNFEESQEDRIRLLRNKFALGEISVEQLDQLEKENNLIKKRESDRTRNQAITRTVVGIAVAAIAGRAVSYGIGSINHIEAATVTNSTTVNPEVPPPHQEVITAPATQPIVVDDTVHEAPKLHDPSGDKLYEDPNNTVSRTHVSTIHPLKGDYNTGGESTIRPHEGRFETNTEADIHPKEGDFNEGEPHTLEATPAVPKGGDLINNQKAPLGAVETNKINTGTLESRQVPPAGATDQATASKVNTGSLESKQVPPGGATENTASLTKPITLSKPVELSVNREPTRITTEPNLIKSENLAQPGAKINTGDLASKQVSPAGATEQASAPKIDTGSLESKQVPPGGAVENTASASRANTETLQSRQVPPSNTTGQQNSNPGDLANRQSAPVGAVDQTTPKANQDNLANRQVPPAGAVDQASLPKSSGADLANRQTAPLGTVDKLAATPAAPKVEEAVVSPRSSFNNGSGRPISPTRGVFNTGGNAYSAPLEARTPNLEPGNGFTTPVNLTNEAGVESVYDNQHGSIITTRYETTAAEPTTIEGMEADARHLEKASDVRDVFGRRNVVLEKPEHDTIHDIKVKDLNKAIDDKLAYKELKKQVKFESYSDYQKERELQSFFGDAKQSIEYDKVSDKLAPTIHMHYFRELPEWKIVQKIPAKYFFDFTNVKEFNGTTMVDLPKGDLDKLLDAGIIKKEMVTVNGIDTEKYVFSRHDDLLRLQKVYTGILSKEDIALGNNMPLVTNTGDENIESYIRRLTRRVFETDDGTYFAPKKLYVPSVETDGNVVQQEQIYTGGSMQGQGGAIAPRYGLYQTRSDYFYNNQLASRARDIIINRMSTPVRLSR